MAPPQSSRPTLERLGSDEEIETQAFHREPPYSSNRPSSAPGSGPPSTMRGSGPPPLPPNTARLPSSLPPTTARLSPPAPAPGSARLSPPTPAYPRVPFALAATVPALKMPPIPVPPVPVTPPSAPPGARVFGTIDEPEDSLTVPDAPIAGLRARTPPVPFPVPPATPPPSASQPTYLSQPPRAPVFTGSLPPPVLIDVTPRALVVETAGGFCDTVIPRNAKIPCERTRIFGTAKDGQVVVRVRVAQGEAPVFHANTYLGEVELGGIRAAARGEVSVSVTFELDADGTLRVRASDTTTGREATAQLYLTGVVAEADIASMRQRMEQSRAISG